MKKTLLILCLLILSFGNAFADFNYQDDFNSLNRDFWLVWDHGGHTGPYPPNYSLAQVSNGILSLPVNTTDHGPELVSKAIPITSNSVVTASWRSKVHYANEYFYGMTAFVLVDYNGNYDPDKGDSIRPPAFWDENIQKENHVATVYYRNYVYNNYDPPVGGNNFGFCAKECFVTTPKWDQFVEYKVVLDFKNNEAQFWQDGALVGSSPMRDDLDLSKFKYLKIWFSPYGWWTGHEMQLDWFRLTVSDIDTTADCSSCFPQLNSDYSLHLPAVTIGDSAYSLDFVLGSITPQVTFNLSGYDAPQCGETALSTCSSCLPSFDLATNVLHIPFIEIGNTAYSFDLSLNSIMPVVSIKLDSYDIGMCDVVDNGGSGNQSTCSDCSCPDYASSHPEQCGRTSNLNFRITWNDANDVDLHVVYKANDGAEEEISYRSTTGDITGGTLDVDSNAECTRNTSTHPVENIVYDNPPPGTYTVKVCGYMACTGGPSTSQVLVQTLVNGQVTKEETVSISNWSEDDASCVTVFTHNVTGSSSSSSGSSPQTMSGVLDTTGNSMVSFVRNEFTSSYISDYDLGLEPWCIDGVALCGNFAAIGNVPLSSSITPPTSGYLSDEAGFDDCVEIDPTQTYVNKNRDGSYTAFRITSHTKLGSCDHKIQFDYINLQ